MISYLFESSVCLAVFTLMYAVLLRSERNYALSRVILLVSLVMSIAIPLLNLPVYPVHALLGTTPAQSSGIQTAGLSQGVLIAYFTGAFLAFLIFIWRAVRLVGLMRGLRNPDIHSSSASGPLSFFNFIYIPDDIPTHAKEIIKLHEYVHVKHLHSLDLIAAELVKILLWFHPGAYLMHRYLREVHEFMADAICCGVHGVQAHEYVSVMQTMSSYIKPAQRLSHTFSSFTKKRIIMLHSTKKRNSWKYIMTLPLLFMLLHYFSFCTYPVTETTPSGIPTDNADADTVIIFDPQTYEAKMTINGTPVSNEESGAVASTPAEIQIAIPNNSAVYGDTIVIFDPETLEETQMVVKNPRE